MDRPEITGKEIGKALADAAIALAHRLNEKGPGSFVSIHEIESVVREECNELTEAAHKKSFSRADIKAELLDVAVAAIFAYACADSNKIDW